MVSYDEIDAIVVQDDYLSVYYAVPYTETVSGGVGGEDVGRMAVGDGNGIMGVSLVVYG